MTDLPNMPSFENLALKPEQRCNKVFNAIMKTLLHNRNQWMTAMQLVEDCRKLDLAQLRGNTPRATIQGAISTGLSTARSLKAEPPIEKYKATYGVCYRISLKLFPKDSEVIALMDMNPPPDNVNQNPPVRRPRPKARKLTFTKKKSQSQTQTQANRRKSQPKKFVSAIGKITQTKRSSKSRQQLYEYTSESDSEESDSDDSESDDSETDESDTDSSDEQPSRKRIAKYHSTSDFTSESESDSSESDISMDTSQQDTNDTLQNEIDNFNSSLCTTNEPSDYDINLSIGPTSFAIAQEIGYSYARFRHQGNMRYPKTKCEDSFYIKDLKSSNGSFLCRLFCLADGHGGSGCSAFLTTQIPDCIENMLRQYDYSQLDDQEVQDKFRQDMTLLIKRLDDEYLDSKREEYRRWQVHDTSVEPVDDGATLVINLFFGEWFININVGDSRTLVGCKTDNKWMVEFSSEDHKPYLERLALQIYSNGGVFVDNQDKPIKFDPYPQDRNVRPNLKNARIRLQAAGNDLGVPYKNNNGIHFSLNVAATCGDLLFKLNPSKPVISCFPDIIFEKLGPFTEYSGNRFMLMSSDGLFDHLYSNKAEIQNQTIATCIGQQLDAGCQLKKIVAHLCNREGDRHLFENTLQEYDDCTCILVLM